MSRRFFRLMALAGLLALLLSGCIGRQQAQRQQDELKTYYTVTFWQDNLVLSQQRVAEGETIPEIPFIDGQWCDADWQPVELAAMTVTADCAFYAQAPVELPALNAGHVRLVTVEGGRFGPDDAVTRGEAAQMIGRLFEEDAGLPENGKTFSDVPEDSPAREAVGVLAALRVMNGYPDGTFRPEEPISRGEFAAVLTRLAGGEPAEDTSYPDVPDSYWGADLLAAARRDRLISGYPDGQFYPDSPLTRAEAVYLLNRARGREPDREVIDLVCQVLPYSDVTADHWAFYDIIDVSYSSELLNYITGEADAEPGFILLDGQLCHVNAGTLCLDRYEAGFHEIEGGLYYVAEDGYFIQRFQPGLVEIDRSMYYVPEEDGPFLRDDSFGYLTFGPDGRYTSGSETVDGYVDTILAGILYNTSLTRDQKLYQAYCAIRDGGYTYLSRDTGWQRGTTSWSLNCARVMYETKGGACYYWASAFLYLARRLGYQAYPVCGGVGTKNQLHAWVVIDWDDGESYIFDVELEWAYSRGFYGGEFTPTDMYKQPLDATKVIYVFPDQTATYYGVSEANDEEDAIYVPEGYVEPEPPAETESPGDPQDPEDPDNPLEPVATDSPEDPLEPVVTDSPDNPLEPVVTDPPADPQPVEPDPPADPEPQPVEPDPPAETEG